ncbi:MAG: Fic family protein [Lentisphaerae bacterium]|nr:Fic family protein [Lentisphaerota bacterium]
MFGCILPCLPPKIDLESKVILKKVNEASRELAVLKGYALTIPNQYVLINALSLQEAKDSSEIESIITTHDELYRVGLFEKEPTSQQAKEVKYYAEALTEGFHFLQKGELLTINNICAIQRILERNDAGLRKQSGTTLKNAATGEIVYTPPQDPEEIIHLMNNLEKIINDDQFWPDIDPLIKMAVIHYQFESIHPFYDGNGRTGRIINVLYLVLKNLLNAPILYLSRYIISHKGEYYSKLQRVRENEDWESFILFMLDAVIVTSQMTTRTVQQIVQTQREMKVKIRNNYQFYSKDLVDVLFLYPYTRIQHLQDRLKISRQTASNYLNKLSEGGILEKMQLGKHLFFINKSFFDILSQIPCDVDKNVPEIITDDGK